MKISKRCDVCGRIISNKNRSLLCQSCYIIIHKKSKGQRNDKEVWEKCKKECKERMEKGDLRLNHRKWSSW